MIAMSYFSTVSSLRFKQCTYGKLANVVNPVKGTSKAEKRSSSIPCPLTSCWVCSEVGTDGSVGKTISRDDARVSERENTRVLAANIVSMADFGGEQCRKAGGSQIYTFSG